MVSALQDATEIIGENTELGEIAELASGQYREHVRERMPRDYVRMYHPDGTTSIVQLPPLGKGGKGRKDRQQKLIHYVMNKRRDGRQWWFPSPPQGWKEADLPWRCPVQGCTRAGGLPDLLNLYRHINQKHPGEVELYQGVITAIKERLASEIPIDLQNLLNSGGAVVSEEDLKAATFEDAAGVMGELPVEPAVPPETFNSEFACPDCDYVPPSTSKNPRAGLQMHRRHRHEEQT